MTRNDVGQRGDEMSSDVRFSSSSQSVWRESTRQGSPHILRLSSMLSKLRS